MPDFGDAYRAEMRRIHRKAMRPRKQRPTRNGEQDRRMRDYRSATNRPSGELDAQTGWVGSEPALYEQGGYDNIYGEGDPRRTDTYYGQNGPLGSKHGHIVSRDGDESIAHWRDSGQDGAVYYDE